MLRSESGLETTVAEMVGVQLPGVTWKWDWFLRKGLR
jgi:hypothetical protein